MSYYFDSYYLCGDKKFFNIYQAFQEQKTSGHFPTFVIDNDLIKSIGDFKRPKKCSRHALQDMMIKRLKQIRAKYGKLKLAYGGGTDSYTIVKLCVENDIYIDETVTLMCSLYGNLRTNLEPYAGLKSLKQYQGKQIGKITQIHPTVKDLDFIIKSQILPGRMQCSRKEFTPQMAAFIGKWIFYRNIILLVKSLLQH